ncbi:MAG TPA: ABC-three component system protein [Pyrinomonadaceae bacterium]|jgi:hypothetical protein
MSENKVIQSENEVGGDQAARDIIHNRNKSYYNYGDLRNSVSPVQSLYAKYELEKENNPQLTEFIEELNYYYNKVDGDVIGLEKKLENGNRQSFIKYALRAKEAYHKKLYKNQFSEVAQQINVYFLALIDSYFTHIIYPKICGGASNEEINILIQENVINRVLSELGENTLGFTATDINGMLYFLTGNCHIEWTN